MQILTCNSLLSLCNLFRLQMQKRSNKENYLKGNIFFKAKKEQKKIKTGN